jgi:hypothetical protein
MSKLSKLLGLQCSKEDTDKADKFGETIGTDFKHCRVQEVGLPSGRRFEISSREGADDYVDTVGKKFISENLITTNDTELIIAYMTIITVIEEASPEKIASEIPESELRTFIEYTRDTLDTLSTDRDWHSSGTISMCHELLLQASACYAKHSLFLKIFLSSDGMEAVAKFYASRTKNDTPSHVVVTPCQ